MSIFKKRESSPFINLSATFDTRSNNQVLNIGDESTKLVCYSLENADEFKSYSVSTRNGTRDLSNGLVNTVWNLGTVFNLDGNPTTLPTGVNFQNVNFSVNPQTDSISNTFPSWGNIIIPSGNFNLYSGNVFVQGTESTSQVLNPEMLLPVEVEMYLYVMLQTPLPLSGISFMKDLTAPLNIRNIAMSGTYLGNTLPYPRLINSVNIFNDLPQPVAISDKTFINFGNYSGNSSINWNSDLIEIPFRFTAPYPVSSGNVYYIMPKFTLAPEATKARNFRIEATYTPVLPFQQPDDLYPNSILGQVSGVANNYFVTLLDPNNDITNTKLWLKTDIQDYLGATQVVVENPTVNLSDFAMLETGDTGPSGSQRIVISGSVINGLVAPPPVETTTAPFGQLMFIPSGLHTIYGGYFYANTYSGISFHNKQVTGIDNYAFYTRDLNTWNPNSYTVDYVLDISEISTSGGSISAGTYAISGISSIASFSGTYTFTNPVDIYVGGPNYNLEKIYGLFDTPVVISGNTNMPVLFSVKFLKQGTNELIDDYTLNYFNTTPTSVTNIISSPLLIGLNTGNMYSGTYLTNQIGDDELSWNQYNNGGSIGGIYDLGCGIITVPDENAITLIHDLRNPSSRNQKVIYGYSDKLAYSTFSTPEKSTWTTLWSGAAINNDALWSAITWNRNGNTLLLADQYAQSSGISWDTNYSGLAYHWGQRPTFSSSVVSSGTYSGASTLVSGTYNVLLAVSMQSGGFRASELMASGIQINNAGDWISISGLNMGQQYPFDLNLDATNVFVTDANGAVYFEATLFSGTSLSSTIYPQPIANNIDQVFIGQAINIASGLTVLNTLEPPRPEEYLTQQINRPPFKKVISFFTQVVAAGKSDEQATIFYSPPNEPTIWGLDGFYTGRLPLPDTDEKITGLEKFRQYLICFTTNKTFRIEFDATGGIPFSIVPINPIYGSVGFFATVPTDQGVYTLSTEGPIFCNGQSSVLIGQEILPWFLTLSHTQLEFCYALHNIPKSTITWSLGKEGTSENFALIHNYKEKSWIIRRGQAWNVGAIVRDQDDFEEIWIGDTLGEVKQDDVGDTDTDTLFDDGNNTSLLNPIQFFIETPWISLKDSNARKLYRFLSVDAEMVPNVNLKIQAYFDYETVPRYTRLIDLNSNNPNKRVNLGDSGRLMKLIITNVGVPAKVKVNKFRIDYQTLGDYKPSW